MPVNPNRGAIGRVAVIAVAVMLLLGACVPEAPVAVPTPTEVAPVFVSDAQALAAAEEAYAAYLAMSDLIAQEGGRNPERISPFVTEEQLVVELEGFESLSESGARQRGFSTLRSVDLASTSTNSPSGALVVHVCVDFTNTSFVGVDSMPLQTSRQGNYLLIETRVVRTSVSTVIGANVPLQTVESC
jgi:hypothetical protein